MPLHLLKLAVGIEDIDDLNNRQARWKNTRGNYQHRTRMMPSRAAELLDGGSMYWVIRRMIQVRQPIVALHQKTDDQGRGYCGRRCCRRSGSINSLEGGDLCEAGQWAAPRPRNTPDAIVDPGGLGRHEKPHRR